MTLCTNQARDIIRKIQLKSPDGTTIQTLVNAAQQCTDIEITYSLQNFVPVLECYGGLSTVKK